VFQGQADGQLMAYRADNGELLWSFDVGSGISAPPITYAVDGKQYVSLLVGWGGAVVGLGGSLASQHGWPYGVHQRRLITFSLDGLADLPSSPPPMAVEALAAPEFAVDQALASQGEELFRGVCTFCHGPVVVSGGKAPDLRASAVVLSDGAFDAVVSGGERRMMGMPRFPNYSETELRALQHYIRREAEE
jgi:quinohemoprotein ethanol dehydrogenase